MQLGLPTHCSDCYCISKMLVSAAEPPREGHCRPLGLHVALPSDCSILCKDVRLGVADISEISASSCAIFTPLCTRGLHQACKLNTKTRWQA